MRRFIVLLLGLATGCSGSSSPQPDNSRKDAPGGKPSAVEIKSNHDYTGWSTIAPNGAGFEVRFPEEPTLKSSTPDRFGTSHLIAIRRLALDHLGFVCTWRLLDRLIEGGVSIDSFLRGAQAAELRTPMARL